MVDVNDAGYWRNRAEETRLIAAGMRDRQAKGVLLNIAAEYDRLERRTEQRSAARSGSRPKEMPQNKDGVSQQRPSAAELRARAARYREMAKQYSAEDVNRMLGLAAEMEETAAAMEKR